MASAVSRSADMEMNPSRRKTKSPKRWETNELCMTVLGEGSHYFPTLIVSTASSPVVLRDF